jgi:hypothetical protein
MSKLIHTKQSHSSSDRSCMLLSSCMFLWRCCTQATWSALGVRGKIQNSTWYCLSLAFLCISYSRNTADRTTSMSGNKLIYRLGGGGWEGELWMKRNDITAYYIQLCSPPGQINFNCTTALQPCQRNRHAENLRLRITGILWISSYGDKVPIITIAVQKY